VMTCGRGTCKVRIFYQGKQAAFGADGLDGCFHMKHEE
jgi:hypothetical protein